MPGEPASAARAGAGGAWPRRSWSGEAAGRTQCGVTLVGRPPGSGSCQGHWHSHEDEFIYVLAGEVTLVSEAGTEVLHAGDAAGFRAGDPDGHTVQNRSAAEVLVLEVGSRAAAREGLGVRAPARWLGRRNGRVGLLLLGAVHWHEPFLVQVAVQVAAGGTNTHLIV